MSMKSRKKLSLVERQQIYMFQEQGYGIREISRRVRRNASTISRELKRNRPPGYNWDSWSKAKYANDLAMKRRRKPRFRLRLKNLRIRRYVSEKVELGWTPELISGRIGMELVGEEISHEAVYQYVYQDARELIEHLPVAGKRGRARGTIDTETPNISTAKGRRETNLVWRLGGRYYPVKKEYGCYP